VTITEYIAIVCKRHQTGTVNYLFPQYGHLKATGQQTIEAPISGIPNFNHTTIHEFSKRLNLEFVTGKVAESNVCFANNTELRDAYRTTFTPMDLLDYTYAILHAPYYHHEAYRNILEIYFPRVPFPKDVDMFWKLVHLGGELRAIHLTKNTSIDVDKTTFIRVENVKNNPQEMDPKISRKGWELLDSETQLGRIWLSNSTYIDKVPLPAWEFLIDGHYPAKKWLHDRKDIELELDAITEFQQILGVLYETDRIMKEIGSIEIE
jgi:predicted helicase